MISPGVSWAVMLLGFGALFFGASMLVDGAARLADKFGIPRATVGLTIVAFGTSAPELIVNVLSAVRGELGFALSNVAGSNLANLCLGFGLSAVLAAVAFPAKTFRIDLAFAAAAPLVILGGMAATGLRQVPFMTVALLSIGLIAYIRQIAGRMRDDDLPQGEGSALKATALFLFGGALLYAGGEFTLRSALVMAKAMGIPETVVGLTLVAVGTSIPDISATVIAFRKGEHELAIGNILGSNVSNVLVVLNATMLTAWGPLQADPWLALDFSVVVGISVVTAAVVMSRNALPKAFGWLLVLGYAGYLTTRALLSI